MHEEESWCYSRGCPACTTLHTLETESTIRLAITAALMAESSSASAPGGGGVQLSAFLPALQRATEDDEFWDPSFWAYFYTKASALRDAIHALIAQASELEVLVLSPRPGRSPISSPVHSPERSPVKSRTLNLEMRTASPTRNAAAMNGNGQRIVGMPRLEPSPLAKQQAKLDQEQRAMLNRAAWQVYSAVGMPPAERIALRAQARRRGMEELGLSARGRSLTA